MKNKPNPLRDFYILWSTQSLSHLGSSITSFALTLWLYEKTGSALGTAALTICTYAPYVILSIFAGAITDRFDKKKTMLVCDVLAALTTVLVFVLYRTNELSGWHLYGINAFSGLMNTVQQPASEVTYTLVIPRKYDQKTSGLQSLSRSLISIGNPLIASALYGFGGLNAVIAIDLITFAIAFLSLLCMIQLPKTQSDTTAEKNVLRLAKEGLQFLRKNPLILYVILFMSGVNLIASAFDAVLPALVIPRSGNGTLGIMTSCSGVAMVLGSVIVSAMPKPKKQGPGDLSDDVVFTGNREFSSGFFQKSHCVVHGTNRRMDAGPGDERKSKRHHAKYHSRQFTGKSLCLPKYAPVLYDSYWPCFGGLPGGSCL